MMGIARDGGRGRGRVNGAIGLVGEVAMNGDGAGRGRTGRQESSGKFTGSLAVMWGQPRDTPAPTGPCMLPYTSYTLSIPRIL